MFNRFICISIQKKSKYMFLEMASEGFDFFSLKFLIIVEMFSGGNVNI